MTLRRLFDYNGRMTTATPAELTTVQDLIRILSRYPSDLRVVVEGYEDGYDDLDPSDIRRIEIILNKNTYWWSGRHECVWRDDTGAVPALLLGRPHRDDDD